MENKSYRNLKIDLIPVGKIKPYRNNAKLHPDYQIEEIVNSIKLFGFKDPLALDKDFEIIEGHGRYFAAKKLGMEELPCMIFEDMTDAKKYLYSIVHNKLTMNTGFNENLLQQELEKISVDIDFEDFDFESVGIEFEPVDIDNLDIEYNELAEKNKDTMRTPAQKIPVRVGNYLFMIENRKDVADALADMTEEKKEELKEALTEVIIEILLN